MLMAAGVAAAGAVAVACAPTARVPLPTRVPEPPVTTGDEALARLMRGNERFVAQLIANPNQSIERREEVAGGQTPFAIILGCADSRVPPEIIFDQGLGDLFVVRLAGNVFDASMGVGSIEYAVEHFHCPLLMVLGHQACGAVEATVDSVKTNSTPPSKIADLVQALTPPVLATQGQAGDWLDNAVQANVLHVVDQLKNADPFITVALSSGKLKLVGAYYNLQSGKVDLLDT